MNVGLIGFGYWGKNILRNLLINKNINNIYVHDVNLNSKFNKKTNPKYIKNKKKFFSIKEIDLYIIATPTKTHYQIISKCLKLNKYVCVTKPFVFNINEIKKLQKNHKNLDKIFLDHTYLFHSSVKYLKKLIKAKKLGKLIYYDSERISFGKFYTDVNVIDDLAVHDLYILDYLLDGEMPKKIKVTSQNIFKNKKFMSTISINYPSGFFANIKVSWYSPIKSRRILLAGNKKIVEFDDNESDKKIKIYNKGIEFKSKQKINQWLYRNGEIEIPNIFHKESLSEMIEELLKFVKRKKSNKNIFNHGKRVMKVLSKLKGKM